MSMECGLDWDRAYAEDHTPWDLRGVTVPLLRLVQEGGLERLGVEKRARVAVPGCGRGHDLKVFSEHGYEVTGFDIVQAAVAEAQSLCELNEVDATVMTRDVLGLVCEFESAFELVYDYTSFCAMPKHLRGLYCREMAGILAPDGLLLMLAFPLRPDMQGRPGRPPFLISESELMVATEPYFDRIESFAAQDSPKERVGAERWFVFRKRPDVPDS